MFWREKEIEHTTPPRKIVVLLVRSWENLFDGCILNTKDKRGNFL